MRKKIYGMLAAASMLMLALGTTVEAVNDPQITGILESSKVQIKVDIEGDEKNVVTGGNIEKRVFITNLGTECYIRITPEFSKNEKDLVNLVLGIPESWINLNGVYYYRASLSENERIQFCTGVEIPLTAEGGDLDFGIKAEAIQSANFNPDFETENPWGDVDILAAKDDDESEVNYVEKETKGSRGEGLEIYYNEDAKKMVSNFDEIFSSVPNLHPGDSFTEVIELQNPTESEKVFYIADMTDESELLKHIGVEVSSEISGEVKNLYKGSLADGNNGEYLEVGTLAPGEGGKLIVQVNMEEEAGNEASGLSGHVALSLDAENKGEKPNDSIINTIKPEDTGKVETPVTNQPVIQWHAQPENNNQNLSETLTENNTGNILNVSDDGEGKVTEASNIRSAKTGDDFNPGKGFVFAGVLLAAGLLLVLRPRKRIRR